jgi:uncharacterized membrane protein
MTGRVDDAHRERERTLLRLGLDALEQLERERERRIPLRDQTVDRASLLHAFERRPARACEERDAFGVFAPSSKEGSMFGRKSSTREAITGAAGTAVEYGGQFVGDEKMRKRTMAAIAAAVAARERTKRQMGLVGLGTRLATDPVLRAQLAEVAAQLQGLRTRAERKQSHKLRNFLLLAAGFGAVTAAVKSPGVRDRVLGFLHQGKDAVGGSKPAAVSEQIEVAVPVTEAYNQWTQFEQFPQFMTGVDEVRQLDDTLLRWAATVAGKRAEWDAKIVEQQPDERITWQSEDGKRTRGTVTFQEAGTGRTRIDLSMSYTAEGAFERAGSAVGLDARQIRGDLERFKELIESQGFADGAWRGEIHEGTTTK